MPFVTDISGPHRPVEAWPELAPGVVRRTSTIDTHPARTGDSEVVLRARDAVGRPEGQVDVLDRLEVRAHLAGRTIEDISATPGDDRLAGLLGGRVGPGFRASLSELLPDDVRRGTLLHLLLDDWVGAALVSGYALQHTAVTLGIEEKMPPGTTERMTGICAGFAPDGSLVAYAKRIGTIPSGRGPVVPVIDIGDGMHPVEPLRPHGMRRMRRLDLMPEETGTRDFDAHFRDSHVDGEGVETIVHEYTVSGSIDEATRKVTAVTADVRVLPWQECPGAIGSATRILGMELAEIRERVRAEFVGITTCTHLNDTLRAVADLGPLLDL